MKAKTINQIIVKKFNEFLDSIEDSVVRDLVNKNTVITGGCITSMLLNEKVNDFDLYFTDRETVIAVANYYVSRFDPVDKSGVKCPIYVDDSDECGRVKIVIKSAGIASEDGTKKAYEYFESRPVGEAAGYVSEVMQDVGDIQDQYEETEALALEAQDEGKPKFRPVFMSTNAITLSHRIQLVLRFYGEPDQIHENYDYVHCTNYWSSRERKLVLRQPALEAILAKELRYVGSKYPLASLIRMRKFIRRGWQINAGQILKICMQLNDLDLTNVGVLEDQLTGVDVAYFLQVISLLREQAGESTKIDKAYLIEIIDRMF